jgi:hypothetical protein
MTFDEQLCKLTMRVHRFFARSGCGARQAMKQRKNVTRIQRATKSPLDVLSQTFGFVLLRVHQVKRGCSRGHGAAQRQGANLDARSDFALRLSFFSF